MAATVAKLRGREAKERRLRELVEDLKRHSVVGIVDLTGTRTNILQELKRRLGGKAVIKVAKKTLLSIAAEQAGFPALSEYVRSLKKPAGIIFTNMNAFLLKLELDRSKVLVHARAGERAGIDVVVPEMNTGLQPGPILSEFGKMKIPTKIEGGSIWIARETTVARKGEEISPALASLLVRLDIRSVYKGINLVGALDSGLLIPPEKLTIDLEATEREVALAHQEAIALAVEASLMLPETTPLMVARAARNAVSLALEAGILERDVIGLLLARAEAHAEALRRLMPS